MKTVDEIIQDWEEGQAHVIRTHPDSIAAKKPFHPDKRDVKAARRVWENLGCPTDWSERTMLIVAGCFAHERANL